MKKKLIFIYLLFLLIIAITVITCKKPKKEMVVSTGDVTNISTNVADVSGTIIDLGEGATQMGHYYAKTQNVSASAQKTQLVTSGTGVFKSQLTNLDPGTKYYFKAYLSNGSETVFGEEKDFTTISASVPILITTAISSINTTSATSGGNITSDGGSPVTARGVCWSIAANPTVTGSKTSDGTGTGIFSSSLAGLTAMTTYHVRAYATNSIGTAYGSDITFTTQSIVVPTLTTTAASAITTTTATSGGNISSDGGSNVTARGVCWSTNTNPTMTDAKTSDGAGSGIFTSSMSGLAAATTYHIRAYATNSAGTGYGSDFSFTTQTGVVPSLTTSLISSITNTTATSGGNITSDGGLTVTERGVCWSTSVNPSISLATKTINGTGSGIFSSAISGLNPNTLYYVRAYATNSIGTSYGNQESFTTSGSVSVPVVTTTAISNISLNSANSGGNVTNDGGSPIILRGICYSTSPGPTTSNSVITSPGNIGAFSSSLTGLNPNTTYYVRAYAINNLGTSYGNQVSFTTLAAMPTVVTTVISNITQTTATGGGSVEGDGGSAIILRGICYGTSQNPTTANNVVTASGTTGSFSSSLSGLVNNTTIYVRAFATNIVGTSYGNEVSFILNLNKPGPQVSDNDGNIYNSVIIGNQVWMKENLRTTKFNSGTSIPLITTSLAWITTAPAFCWYNNDQTTYKAVYGALYNWYVVDETSNGGENVCPVGWHVPSSTECTTLLDYLEGETIAGGKMKETGTTNWLSPNSGATNESGFTGLPSGYRHYNDGGYNGSTNYNYIWSTTIFNDGYNWGSYTIRLDYNASNATVYVGSKGFGFSIRCVKD